jgi:hypothetical protein
MTGMTTISACFVYKTDDCRWRAQVNIEHLVPYRIFLLSCVPQGMLWSISNTHIPGKLVRACQEQDLERTVIKDSSTFSDHFSQPDPEIPDQARCTLATRLIPAHFSIRITEKRFQTSNLDQQQIRRVDSSALKTT